MILQEVCSESGAEGAGKDKKYPKGKPQTCTPPMFKWGMVKTVFNQVSEKICRDQELLTGTVSCWWINILQEKS